MGHLIPETFCAPRWRSADALRGGTAKAVRLATGTPGVQYSYTAEVIAGFGRLQFASGSLRETAAKASARLTIMPVGVMRLPERGTGDPHEPVGKSRRREAVLRSHAQAPASRARMSRTMPVIAARQSSSGVDGFEDGTLSSCISFP